MTAQTWIRSMWEGEAGAAGAAARTLLLPAEGLFRLGVLLRERRYRSGSPRIRRAAIPVVSVGNLSVGGTGKTPVASWVLRRLQEAGASPALVARGYGRDELLLHQRWTPGIPVVADADRWAGVAAAAARGADVAVLDDGFQHRRLARELDLVLVSAEEGLPGALLPRGPFREPASALARAHAVIVTRKEASVARARELARDIGVAAPGIPVARLRIRAAAVRPLLPGRGEAGPGTTGEGGTLPLVAGPVLVATAVARPASVAAAAEALGMAVAETVAYPDHHEFTPVEVAALVERAAGRPVVVTEKDAVKLASVPEAHGGDFRVLEQELEWEEGRDALEGLVLRVFGRRSG